MHFSVFDKIRATLVIFLLLAFGSLVSAQTQQAIQPAADEQPVPQLSELSQQIKKVLSTGLMAVAGNANAERFEGIAAHYQQNAFKPIWLVDQLPTQKARDAVEILLNAADHGLNPQDYEANALFQKLGARGPDTLVDLEVNLSRAVVAYAQHLNAGRLDPKAVNREIVIYPKAVASNAILDRLRNTNSIQIFLRLLAPHTDRYERLRIALNAYKLISAKGGWSVVREGEVIKPGSVVAEDRLVALRKRMIEAGHLKENTSVGENYDDVLVQAVKDFQLHHGLEPDGAIGPQTLAQMNTGIEKRIRTMELNLERRRWMQNDYGRYYVFANLADQVVKLVRDEKTIHAELIQVGQTFHRTPVFSDVMEYIELNPYWNVPYSISTKEYLPKLKANAGALVSQNIKVLRDGKIVSPFSIPWNSYSRKYFPVRLRQDSGKKNALGRVKFMFPNKFNVYIHDTPSKYKFKKASRYFSHGCLRLKDPLVMAEKILGPEGWSRKKIDGVIRGGNRRVVRLKTKIPVHVTYLTAWVNKDGAVHFRRDIYGRDKILDLAMIKATQQ